MRNVGKPKEKRHRSGAQGQPDLLNSDILAELREGDSKGIRALHNLALSTARQTNCPALHMAEVADDCSSLALEAVNAGMVETAEALDSFLRTIVRIEANLIGDESETTKGPAKPRHRSAKKATS